MKPKRFKLAHSIVGVVALLVVEALGVVLFKTPLFAAESVIAFSILGAIGIVVVSTQVIREVKNADHMLFLLSAVIAEFVVFFTFQYWFLSIAFPASFQGLLADPVSMLLNSTMIFALNPLYLPTNVFAKGLLLVNTLGALSIVLFVLQNIWQFRGPQSSENKI